MSNRRRFLGELVGGAATVALSGVLNSRQTFGASDRIGSGQAYTRLGNLTSWSASENRVQFKCEGGAMVALKIATPEMMRVRVAPDGHFAESLSIKLGFVKDDWLASPFQTHETNDTVWVETSALKIKAAKQPFRLSFFDGQDKPLLKECDAPGMGYSQDGNELRVEMAPDEHFYGLGFHRQSLDVRGTKLAWKRAFRHGEATVGFFLSTRGYGFYTNNTFHHTFDFTEKEGPSNYYSVSAEGGQLDYYIISGPSFREIIQRYTDLTGKPWKVPRWAMGLLYICRCYPEKEKVLAMARSFRERDIPLDMIGLEPGWEKTWYTMDWNWHPQRFPNPEAVVKELAGMGLKMEMWESGDAPKSGYMDPEVRKQWYDKRLDASLKIGVKFFKQDDPYPRMIDTAGMEDPILNSPLGKSGKLTPQEAGNLANSLYCETAMNEARRVTGERAMTIFNSYFSSVASHRWPFTWAADFAAGAGLLSAGLSAHSIATLDMQNNSPRGLHMGFLMPFSIIDAWAYYREPWCFPEPIEEMNRFYAKLKYRLIPYLYTTTHQAVATGLPTLRAMIIDQEENPELFQVDSQYMLGDWLLVGSKVDVEEARNVDMGAPSSLTEKIYLPRGTWFDYWTGETIESAGAWHETSWPDAVGGALFVKGGAIIPMGQVAGHSEEEALEVVVLDVYPCGESQYTLHEDDGVSYEYERGVCATTEMRCRQSDGSVVINVGERKGSYRSMPERRSYLLSVHTATAPKAVTLGARQLKQFPAKSDLLYNSANRGWSYDGQTKILWVKPAGGWRYDYDRRGPKGDVDRDTVVWDEGAEAKGGAWEVVISLPTEAELKSVPNPLPGPAAGFKVGTQYDRLVADGSSQSTVTITVVDRAGLKVENADTAIKLNISGEGRFVGGSRNSIIHAKDGVVTAVVTSTEKPGHALIQASAPGLKASKTSIETVRGQIELKANPPARFVVGTWPPDDVTLYATVRAGGKIMKSYHQTMELRVTGQPEGIKADLQAKAVKGIATFEASYKVPPKYVFRVTGPGLEPAEIPIY